MDPLVDVTLRSLAVYVFMLLCLRLFGKNQLSQLNAGDVILLLLISNAVQNAMVGENTTLQGGLTAAFVLFVANFVLKRLLFRNTRIRSWIEEDPRILIKDGKLDTYMLQKVEITPEEVLEVVREHGVEHIEEVKLAVLEVDGNISVISLDHNQQTHYTHHKKRLRRRFRN
ncbi:DUF421 domain-containing protein [Crocinitomicaceae bacterium CZZ-1]|uniref:DUF421 domain-containing protein n=1 Tax=Taishania pollutisoli TaxID=2766479 RepID=A0A8J6TTT9_9FLAO|nr:YetF domain-containing protein [Taishania pollutisoli]MBC9813359.1 DUF421 domain-containing protein [Taishania pollutisoli]